MTTKNTTKIKRSARGEKLTAAQQNRVADAINADTTSLRAPSYTKRREFREYQRTSNTVTITDSSGDTFDIEQIDSITFRDSDGYSLVLKFNNPPAV